MKRYGMNLAARLRNQLKVNQTMIGHNLMDISYSA
jgi:hypothetical protein